MFVELSRDRCCCCLIVGVVVDRAQIQYQAATFVDESYQRLVSNRPSCIASHRVLKTIKTKLFKNNYK